MAAPCQLHLNAMVGESPAEAQGRHSQAPGHTGPFCHSWRRSRAHPNETPPDVGMARSGKERRGALGLSGAARACPVPRTAWRRGGSGQPRPLRPPGQKRSPVQSRFVGATFPVPLQTHAPPSRPGGSQALTRLGSAGGGRCWEGAGRQVGGPRSELGTLSLP